MRGNAHVRFGGAGRGDRPLEMAVLRPGPTPTGTGWTPRTWRPRSASSINGATSRCGGAGTG